MSNAVREQHPRTTAEFDRIKALADSGEITTEDAVVALVEFAKLLERELGGARVEEIPAKLWLWRNHVDGCPEYWAFDNPFPIHMHNDDPQTLGEPCGYALVKPSRNGRPHVQDAEVLAYIKGEASNERVPEMRPGFTCHDGSKCDAMWCDEGRFCLRQLTEESEKKGREERLEGAARVLERYGEPDLAATVRGVGSRAPVVPRPDFNNDFQAWLDSEWAARRAPNIEESRRAFEAGADSVTKPINLGIENLAGRAPKKEMTDDAPDMVRFALKSCVNQLAMLTDGGTWAPESTAEVLRQARAALESSAPKENEIG